MIPLIDIMSVLVAFLLIYSAEVEVVQNTKGIEIPQSSAETQAAAVGRRDDHEGAHVRAGRAGRERRGSAELDDTDGRAAARSARAPDAGGRAATMQATASREVTVIADK